MSEADAARQNIYFASGMIAPAPEAGGVADAPDGRSSPRGPGHGTPRILAGEATQPTQRRHRSKADRAMAKARRHGDEVEVTAPGVPQPPAPAPAPAPGAAVQPILQPLQPLPEGQALVSMATTPPATRRKPTPTVMPAYYEAPRVYIRTVFMKVGQIDTVKEEYEADIFIAARWREPELDRKQIPEGGVNWDEMWNPELVVQNLIDSKLEKVWRTVEHTQTGEAFVVEKRRVKGNFSESMELQSFPFDTQCLSIVVTSEDEDLEFHEDTLKPSRINHANFVDQQEWRAHDVVEYLHQDGDPNFAATQPEQSAVTFRIYASRMSGFFVFNILAVMALITSLFLCVWSVERTDVNTRLMLTVTLVLTSVAFKFVSNQSMPKISYTTLLDKYIMSCMALMHVTAVYHALVCTIDDSGDAGNLADLIGFCVACTLFVMKQIIFICVVKTKINRERNNVKLLERQFHTKIERMRGAALHPGGKKRGGGRGVSPYN